MAVISLTEDKDVYAALNAGDTINGLSGDDELTATNGGNTLFGGNGGDTLNGGLGNDVLQGDDLNNWNGANIMNGAAGDDYIVSNSSRDEIDAGSGDDTVEVWRMDEINKQVLQGGTGNDRLVLYAQQTFIYLLDFSSSFTVKHGIAVDYDTFTGFESLEFIGGEFRANILASEKDDSITINNLLSETFEAGALDGRGGNDSFVINGVTRDFVEDIDGGTGKDSLGWSQGVRALTNVTIDAAGGTMADGGSQFMTFRSIESISVNASNVLGNFSYQGLAGIDSVTFNGLTASVRTGAGNDYVSAGAGKSAINTGSGDDYIRTLEDITARADVGCGGGDDNVIIGCRGQVLGDGGNDTIRSIYNRASVYGGSGDDTITRQSSFNDEGSTSAVIDGGADTDTLTLIFNIVYKTIRADFSQAAVTLFDGMSVQNFEIVHYQGGNVKDVVTASNHAGGAEFNTVDGRGGDDRLSAAAAGATLEGGYGNDTLIGGASADIMTDFGGDDTFSGGGGNDQIAGGMGVDTMRGGAGADTFLYNYWPMSGTTEATRDVISDFSHGQGDKIDFAGMDANTNTFGVDDVFSFRGTKAFTGVAGQLRFEQIDNAGTDNDVTLVMGDVNGDSIANFVIELTGLIDLRASDFAL